MSSPNYWDRPSFKFWMASWVSELYLNWIKWPLILDNPGWLYLYGEYDLQTYWYHDFQQDVSQDNISTLQLSQSRAQKLRWLLTQIGITIICCPGAQIEWAVPHSDPSTAWLSVNSLLTLRSLRKKHFQLV